MRNVLVSGGSRGIGLATVRRLADAGYSAIAVARKSSDQLAKAIAEAEQGKRGRLSFVAFDFNDVDGISGLLKQVRRDFGPLYGLVNNAALGTEGVLATMHNAKIEQLVRVNTVAPMVLTKYAVRSMMSAGEGRIVNVASIIGFTGYSGLSVYAATKASLIGFTRSLAREVGKLGINVNAVAPGFIDTDMTESLAEGQREQVARRSALRRLPEVEDVADAVEFLIGPKARNITGTVLTVDAGSTA